MGRRTARLLGVLGVVLVFLLLVASPRAIHALANQSADYQAAWAVYAQVAAAVLTLIAAFGAFASATESERASRELEKVATRTERALALHDPPTNYWEIRYSAREGRLAAEVMIMGNGDRDLVDLRASAVYFLGTPRQQRVILNQVPRRLPRQSPGVPVEEWTANVCNVPLGPVDSPGTRYLLRVDLEGKDGRYTSMRWHSAITVSPSTEEYTSAGIEHSTQWTAVDTG